MICVSDYWQKQNVTRALDYVVKPLSSSELAARIRTALRQRAGLGRAAQPQLYARGDLSIDCAERWVTLAGSLVELTPTERCALRELLY